MIIQSKRHEEIRRQFKDIKEQNLFIMDAIQFLASYTNYILRRKCNLNMITIPWGSINFYYNNIHVVDLRVYHKHNQTWTLIPLLPNRHPIGCKCVFLFKKVQIAM